jgi:hypothetical protein
MHVYVLFETTEEIPTFEHLAPALTAALTGVVRAITIKPPIVKEASIFFIPKAYLAKLDLSVLSSRIGIESSQLNLIGGQLSLED